MPLSYLRTTEELSDVRRLPKPYSPTPRATYVCPLEDVLMSHRENVEPSDKRGGGATITHLLSVAVHGLRKSQFLLGHRELDRWDSASVAHALVEDPK